MSHQFECSEASTTDATSQKESLDLPEDACCIECGYSLFGLVTARCPECGRRFDPRNSSHYFRRDEHRPSRVGKLIFWSFVLLFCLLMGLAILAVTFTQKSCSGYRETLTQSQLGQNGEMGQALRFYKQDVGSYPTTNEGLRALYESPRVAQERWVGPYLEGTLAELHDPWGNSFGYVSPGMANTNGYDLWSWGPDEVDDKGAPDSDDIKNWSP